MVYKLAITNELCCHVEQQLMHVMEAISNRFDRVEMEEWEPRWMTRLSGYARGRKLSPEVRWKVNKSLISPNQYAAKKDELEALVGSLREQTNCLVCLRKCAQKEFSSAQLCYGQATNKVEQLKSLDDKSLRRLIEGRADDELMDDLIRLIVQGD